MFCLWRYKRLKLASFMLIAGNMMMMMMMTELSKINTDKLNCMSS